MILNLVLLVKKFYYNMFLLYCCKIVSPATVKAIFFFRFPSFLSPLFFLFLSTLPSHSVPCPLVSCSFNFLGSILSAGAPLRRPSRHTASGHETTKPLHYYQELPCYWTLSSGLDINPSCVQRSYEASLVSEIFRAYNLETATCLFYIIPAFKSNFNLLMCMWGLNLCPREKKSGLLYSHRFGKEKCQNTTKRLRLQITYQHIN